MSKINSSRLMDATAQYSEPEIEYTIRPKHLKNYIGQAEVRQQMDIFIRAAIKRQEALDHVLIFGPPGLGKTTLAHIIANEMKAGLKQTSGPVLEKVGDLAALLTNLETNDVLFIDEIHRLNAAIEEALYPALEDFQLNIIIGEGPSARSIKLDLPSFTLVGATTRAGLLTSPLRDRFGIVQRLEFYCVNELIDIVKRAAHILNVTIEKNGAAEIARRSRGTPRTANRLLRRVRDFAEVYGSRTINETIVKEALDLLNVDIRGLDVMDRKLLHTIIEKFQGGPVGIESLAAAINEERDTVQDVIEPYLIQEGFILRTPRGRIATKQTYQHFQSDAPDQFALQEKRDLLKDAE